ASFRVVDDHIEISYQQAKPFLAIVGSAPVRRLPCPVLSVPSDAVFAGVKKIVIACDRGDLLATVADHQELLDDLFHFLGSSFELIHIARDGEASLQRMIREYQGWKGRPAFLPASPFVIRRQKLQQGITDYFKNHTADWLMVLPKEHGWIEFHRSQAETIAQEAPIPVLRVYE